MTNEQLTELHILLGYLQGCLIKYIVADESPDAMKAFERGAARVEAFLAALTSPAGEPEQTVKYDESIPKSWQYFTDNCVRVLKHDNNKLTAERDEALKECERLRELAESVAAFVTHSGSFLTSYGVEIHGTGKLNLFNDMERKLHICRPDAATSPPLRTAESDE